MDEEDKIQELNEKLAQLSHQQHLDRRQFLKMLGVGTAAGTLGVTGLNNITQLTKNQQTTLPQQKTPTGKATTNTTCTEGEDYDHIKVDPGETFNKTVSGSETWENKLIDITADGAAYEIYAAKGGWTIRNIGVRGKIDTQNPAEVGPFTTDGASAGRTCTVENVYLPGSTYGRNEISTNNPYGLYVSTDHEGELIIRNLHAFDMPSHGLYASDPGHPDGGSGGTVKVHDSYVHDLENSGYRLGTNGSYIDNCTSFRTARGLWAYFDDIEAYNCDLGDNTNDIVVGSGDYEKTASLATTDTRFETYAEPNGNLKTESAGAPEETVPEGCPTSPKEAACGTGTSSNISNDTGIDQTTGSHTIELEGKNEELKNYIIEINGEITSTDGEQLGNHAIGTIQNEKHTTKYEGTVKDIQSEQNIQLIYDGERLNKAQIASLCSGIEINEKVDKDLPDSASDWRMTFEDDFEIPFSENDNWDPGWGWGPGAPGSKNSWVNVPDSSHNTDHIEVRDSNLVLTADKDDYDSTGDIHVGAVHTRKRVTVEPPVYFEAKMNMIPGVGWQNAFWSKPNNENWPPEIDVVEYLQENPSDKGHTSHNIHYSESGQCNDGNTHQFVNGGHNDYNSDEIPGDSFHVYGFEWREDVLRHYVDGEIVEETTDSTVLNALNNSNCVPHYLMLSLNLDNVGTTDKSISWEEKELLIDWVKVWKPDQ